MDYAQTETTRLIRIFHQRSGELAKQITACPGSEATAGIPAAVRFPGPPEDRNFKLRGREIFAVGVDAGASAGVRREYGWSVEEHRLRIALVGIAYRIRSKADFEQGRMEWHLDPAFENDVADIEGFWVLDELPEGRTLG